MTKTIRISERAHEKLAQQCKFGEHLADVLDRLLFGSTANNTNVKKGVKK